MKIQLVISIAVIVILVAIYVIYKIRKIGLKDFAIDMIIKAEYIYNKGENEEKMSYVIDKVIGLLPCPIQFFITRDLVRYFIQKIFDGIKKALDYVPKEG